MSFMNVEVMTKSKFHDNFSAINLYFSSWKPRLKLMTNLKIKINFSPIELHHGCGCLTATESCAHAPQCPWPRLYPVAAVLWILLARLLAQQCYESVVAGKLHCSLVDQLAHSDKEPVIVGNEMALSGALLFFAHNKMWAAKDLPKSRERDFLFTSPPKTNSLPNVP